MPSRLPYARTRATATATAIVLGVATSIALTGCSPYQGEFVELMEANENVASVESSGGGYSDSRWVVVITPDDGLSDTQFTDLAEAIEADIEPWRGPLPEQLRLELGRVDVSLGRDSVPSELIALWRVVNDDARVTAGVVGTGRHEGQGLRLTAAPENAFALASEFAATADGFVVDDLANDTQDWSYSISVDPGCATAVDELTLLQTVIVEPRARGDVASFSLNPCGASAVSASSKAAVLALSRSAESTLDLDAGGSVNIAYSSVEESTGRSRTWQVAVERFSPEVGDLLDLLYASTSVVACELLESGTLRVSLAEGEASQPIERLIEDSGVQFETVLVGSDL